MAHTIIGTAGHIDHGKTLLVKALTGQETDRAPEEKARGITIELGFAFMGDEATIIDVPGHERFVKTMVAGVSSVDVALLVIAADDGVMPQSREHLDILNLLGVERGLIVLNKVDLVEEDWADLVEEEIRELVQGTFLAQSPIIRVSALSGIGIDDLKEALKKEIDRTQQRQVEGPFRLPVDRSFLVKGFGLVCTGTVLSGRIKEGEPVEVLPAGKTLRVRGLQCHGSSVNEVEAGDRAALNLPGVEADEIGRGAELVQVGHFAPTLMLDARLHLLSSCAKPLEQRTRVRLHLGTQEVLARVVLLGGNILHPGQASLVQLRLEAPVVAAWGDPFVIRRYSPALTIGGGAILEPHPSKHRSADRAAVEGLGALEGERPEEVLEAKVSQARTGFKTYLELEGELGLGAARVREVCETLVEQEKLVPVVLDGREGVVHRDNWQELEGDIETVLTSFHQREPLKQGLRREELRNLAARRVMPALFERVLTHLEKVGRLGMAGALVHAVGHQIRLGAEEENLRRQIEVALEAVALSELPTLEELATRLQVDPKEFDNLVAALRAMKVVVTLEGGLVLPMKTLDRLQRQLEEYLGREGQISVADYRDLIGANRKWALALLAHFDREGLTERQGDVRGFKGGKRE